ncbi:hypothetical protein BV898_06249 [Hypsibius exemplaris]|uniref:Uncharacterized protein n=1 Tax=Hypsibius exemplaris TaxID=2072580 RepID=A0A1W0WWY8_HYPEX|nr:hypothetical protein BV898_06249 [Hypsibius exemplaris]
MKSVIRSMTAAMTTSTKPVSRTSSTCELVRSISDASFWTTVRSFSSCGSCCVNPTANKVEEARATDNSEALIAAAVNRIIEYNFWLMQCSGSGWRDISILGVTCQIKFQTQI